MSTAPVSEPRASPLPATWPWGRLVDALLVLAAAVSPWGVAAVPTTLVVDRGGRVVEVKVGLFDDSMETALGTKARAAMLSTIHPGGNR